MSAVERVWGDVSNTLHAERLRYFRARRIGEVLETDGAWAIVTGRTSNIENGVVCDRDELATGAAERLVSWVRDSGVPASWIQAAEDASERLHAELTKLGCREELTGVDLGSRIDDVDVPAEALGVEIGEVRDSAGLATCVRIADSCGFFDEPAIRDRQQALYVAAGLEGPFRHWVAQRDGEPVAMATAFFGRDAVFLEHLAVVPEERRRGVGTALVATPLAEARRRGCEVAVLAATPDSQSFFERLGFSVTRVRPRRWYYL